MYKCPKCDYQGEAPGNCPNDNEVLQEVVETPETPDAAPETEPSVSAEPAQEPEPETTEE